MVATLSRTRSQPQPALEIKIPAGDVLGVFAQQCPFAGGNLQLVEVVPGLVAIVEGYIDSIGIVLGNVDHHYVNALQPGEVSGSGSFCAGCRPGGGIYGE